MTPQRLAAIVAEYERLFRSRTPATSIDHVLCSCRVTFSDLLRYAPEMHATDRETLFPEIQKVNRRLRREFPEERWD